MEGFQGGGEDADECGQQTREDADSVIEDFRKGGRDHRDGGRERQVMSKKATGSKSAHLKLYLIYKKTPTKISLRK